MNHVGSDGTLCSASSQKDTEPSTFERILPQVAENIEVAVPRGMRFALSPAVAGQGKASKVKGFTAKRYSITVEPHARTDMFKEATKYVDSSAEPCFSDYYGLPLQRLKFDDSVMDAIIDERHDRSVFRMERLMKFKQHRFVPALVSERLVPCWRSTGGDESVETPALEAKRKLEAAARAMEAVTAARHRPATSEKGKKKERRRYQRLAFITPTISIAMKRQKKVDVEPPEWHAGGDVRELMHPSYPAFDSGGVGTAWELVDKQKTSEYNAAKSRWLAHDVVKVGKLPKCSEEVKEVRDQSKANLRSLRSQYEQNRSAHKRSSTAPGGSSFERYYKEYKSKEKLAAEEAARQAADEKPSGPVWSNLAGGLSLGLGKRRDTHPSVHHGGAIPVDAPA